MKKLMLILAVLAIAAPAMAVTLTLDNSAGDGWVSINYSQPTGSLPRAFALNVSVDSGVIQDYDAWESTTVTNGCQPYRIHMGNIVIEGGAITDLGSPIAPEGCPQGGCGQLGSAAIILEMGSLYATGEEATLRPATSGTLIKLKVSECCDMTVTSNALRGKIVLEDTTVEDKSVTGEVGLCSVPVCKGDIDGNQWISPSDIAALIQFITPHMPAPEYGWVTADSLPAGDIDNNGWVSPSDIAALIQQITPTMAPPYYGWTACP